jgi:hypothetical protein
MPQQRELFRQRGILLPDKTTNFLAVVAEA